MEYQFNILMNKSYTAKVIQISGNTKGNWEKFYSTDYQKSQVESDT